MARERRGQWRRRRRQRERLNGGRRGTACDPGPLRLIAGNSSKSLLLPDTPSERSKCSVGGPQVEALAREAWAHLLGRAGPHCHRMVLRAQVASTGGRANQRERRHKAESRRQAPAAPHAACKEPGLRPRGRANPALALVCSRHLPARVPPPALRQAGGRRARPCPLAETLLLPPLVLASASPTTSIDSSPARRSRLALKPTLQRNSSLGVRPALQCWTARTPVLDCARSAAGQAQAATHRISPH